VQVHYHSVTFTGLLPDTLYAYRVGSEEMWSEWFHFRTAALGPEPFAFLYFGDAQNDVLSLWARTLRESYAVAPHARFMIHAGDLVNRAHSDLEWGEWFRSGGHIHSMVPSVPAPGNHEYRGYETPEGERPEEPLSVFWRPQFTLPENGPSGVSPETCFYLDFQGVRVVVLNSSEDHEAQALWMDRVLAGNPMRWTVVTHHHPIFSSAGSRDNDELRSLWMPIYDRHGVDLVLQGHDHTYARGRTPPASEPLPIGEDRASGLSHQAGDTGTVYLVSVGGRKMYDFKPTNWDSYPASLDRKAEDTQLFQVIRVEGDTLKFQAFTATGQLFDAFDLVKQEGRPNRLVDRGPLTSRGRRPQQEP
jgi:3',5'-cyclic AMP phosphodiesterase CpdA